MSLTFTSHEKDLVGRLFGAYLNLAIDYNDTISQKYHYPQFSNFTERITKIKSHLYNLEDLSSELGFTLDLDYTPTTIPKITKATLSCADYTLITFDFKTRDLTVAKCLM